MISTLMRLTGLRSEMGYPDALDDSNWCCLKAGDGDCTT